MNIKELYDIVERQMILCEQSHRSPSDVKVCIPIQTVNACGGTVCINHTFCTCGTISSAPDNVNTAVSFQ